MQITPNHHGNRKNIKKNQHMNNRRNIVYDNERNNDKLNNDVINRFITAPNRT